MPPKNNEYPDPLPCAHESEKKTRGLCENCYQRWLYSINEEFRKNQKFFEPKTEAQKDQDKP